MKIKNYKYYIVFFFLAFALNYTMAQSNASCNGGGQYNGSYGYGGDTSTNPSSNSFLQWVIEVIRAGDPNDIIGPSGFDSKKWVSIKDRMKYTIRFENDPKIANAPAQNVFIHLPVDPKININSLQLAEVGFGRFKFTIPGGLSYYSERLDVRDSLGLFVDVTAGIDVIANEIFWIFRSIDPATGTAPTEATKGFLPVNDTTKAIDSLPGKGEGFVSFTFKPKPTVVTGDTVSKKATIIFDIEDPIPTNIWTNTIDAVAPTSNIHSSKVSHDTISLFWSGMDDLGGTGVRDYALFVSENGSPFTLYKRKITDTTDIFIGTAGNTYCFYTIATDSVGNDENFKNNCQYSASIVPGVVLPIAWLYFNGKQKGNDVLLNWATTTEINTKEFVVERSLDGLNFGEIGTVQAAGTSYRTNNYSSIDVGAALLGSQKLYYRIRQVDKDGKFTYSIIVAISISQNNAAPSITAYPNPFTQNINLKIITVSPTDQTDHVSLYSSDGKILYQRKLVNRGNATILLDDLPALTRGVYLLKASVAGKLYTIKMIRN